MLATPEIDCIKMGNVSPFPSTIEKLLLLLRRHSVSVWLLSSCVLLRSFRARVCAIVINFSLHNSDSFGAQVCVVVGLFEMRLASPEM